MGRDAKEQTEPLPYRVRDDFLSAAEISFYHVLSTVVGTQAAVCAKVRLADLFFVSRPKENLSYFNRITQRHVDFLLCDPGSMKPLLGIELDDASHRRRDRKDRDEFVDRTFKAAGLPLLRFPAQNAYNTREVDAMIRRSLVPREAESDKTVESEEVSETDADAPDPLCPKCGASMVVRIARRGAHQGTRFYGCRNYPKCREMIPLREQPVSPAIR